MTSQTAGASQEKAVRHVQINVWLGSRQYVEIAADHRVNIHACKDPMRYLCTDDGDAPDIPALIRELGNTLADALAAGDNTANITVQGHKIVTTDAG